MAEVYEINSEKLHVKINGVAYEYNEPSADQTKTLQEKFKNFDEASDADPMALYYEFFNNLGLPSEALKPLSSKKILDLFGHTVGSKKN